MANPGSRFAGSHAQIPTHDFDLHLVPGLAAHPFAAKTENLAMAEIGFDVLADVDTRHKDTETVGLTYAIVAVVYPVLIAFIVVDVFETLGKGDEVATAEANKLSNLMLVSAGVSPQTAEPIRAALDKYIDIVIKSEWPRPASRQARRCGVRAGVDDPRPV
jgi:hypothetical protein